MKPRRLTLATKAVLISLLAAATLTSCTSDTDLNDCSQAKDAFDEVNEDAEYPLSLIYLDLQSNSKTYADQLATEFSDLFRDALMTGRYIQVVSSGGVEHQPQYSKCFDGLSATKPFIIKTANERADNDDRRKYLTFLQEALSSYIQSQSISETGSLTQIYPIIGTEAASAAERPKYSSVDVLIQSSLLGSVPTNDCLNVNGIQANAANAKAVVTRCFDSGQLSTIQADSVSFLGAGTGAGSPEQISFATMLQTEICSSLSNCKGNS